MARHDDNTHQRLRRQKGSASLFSCIGCEAQAYEWAYQHRGDPEDPEGYAPMCRSCHRKLDLEKSPVLRTSWEKSRHQLTEDERARGRANRTVFTGQPWTTEDARELGHRGGSARAARMNTDPVLAARMAEVSRRTAQKVSRVRRICLDCDLISTPAGMGNHLKSSGHTGYEELI